MKIQFTTFNCLILSSLLTWCIYPQETVTDYDSNVCNTVILGEQIWLQQNLKSLHYSDGTEIPGVVTYDNDNSLGTIYDLLYLWNADMNNSVNPGTQGVCPCSCYVPTDQEWTILDNYLDGSAIAGGKMKEAETEHWQSPNTGATNSGDFTGLPAGELDAYFNPNKFWLLHLAAVFWTSTQSNQAQAWERHLIHDNSACERLTWFKVMKYSIRCIKDSPTEIENGPDNNYGFKLNQNYPNPFNPSTRISYQLPEMSFVKLIVLDILGNEIETLVDEEKQIGNFEVEFDGTGLSSGIYFCQHQANNYTDTIKMLLLK